MINVLSLIVEMSNLIGSHYKRLRMSFFYYDKVLFLFFRFSSYRYVNVITINTLSRSLINE